MKTTLAIQNLKCGGCANTIVKRLSELASISNVAVDNENDTVAFEHENEDHVNAVSQLLSKLGYPVIGEANSLGKKAKSFVSCAVGRMSS